MVVGKVSLSTTSRLPHTVFADVSEAVAILRTRKTTDLVSAIFMFEMNLKFSFVESFHHDFKLLELTLHPFDIFIVNESFYCKRDLG